MEKLGKCGLQDQATHSTRTRVTAKVSQSSRCRLMENPQVLPLSLHEMGPSAPPGPVASEVARRGDGACQKLLLSCQPAGS